MSALKAALLATFTSIAPQPTAVSQQAATASIPVSSDHLLSLSVTDTTSHHTKRAESDMNVQYSDIGADFDNIAANGTEIFNLNHK